MFAEASAVQIILACMAGLVAVMLPFAYLQSRRAERVMRAMKNLLLMPERAKIADAKDLINGVLDGAISKITHNFNAMEAILAQQIARSENLERKLGAENKVLTQTADIAAERIAGMARTLENLVGNLAEIIERKEWKAAGETADDFNKNVGRMLKDLESKSESIARLSDDLDARIGLWSESGRKLSDELSESIHDGSDKMNMMAIAAKGMCDELAGLQKSVSADFENVKLAAHGIEGIMANNEKLLANQLSNMENFTEQAKKLLRAQVNTMSDTANRIGTDIRLAESSIDAGASGLNDTAEKLSVTSRAIKETFDVVAGEIMDVRAKFQTEVDEFSTKVLANLREAESATAHTMENAAHIAAEFRDSVVPMLSNVNGTVASLEVAREQIEPLSELMRHLETSLPEVSEKTGAMTADLTHKISDMAGKISTLNEAASKALTGIGDSTLALEKLSGESRQQMINLMSDYAKAAETMRELTKHMTAAKAAAPKAVAAAAKLEMPKAGGAAVPVQDFARQIGGIVEKLHDLSVDLTRSIGIEIPDSIMDKYKSGDREIFSKWFAKMISNADKKRVRGIFKTDAVFRSQATQFVHGFAKMLTGAERAENKEMIVATLLKTDLGVMYQALRACL